MDEYNFTYPFRMFREKDVKSMKFLWNAFDIAIEYKSRDVQIQGREVGREIRSGVFQMTQLQPIDSYDHLDALKTLSELFNSPLD